MANGKVNRDFLEPEVATTIARQTLADFEFNNRDSLASYLPSQEVADIEYQIEHSDSSTAIVAANWRMFGGATTSERWGQGSQARGRLQPLSRNFVLDEETRLRQRNDSSNAIRRQTAVLVERATKAIAIEVNYQRANAIANGRVEINGSGGLREIVDFGRREDFNTTAPKLFTDPTSDPIKYMTDLVDMYEDENGFRPEEIMMTNQVRAAILRNPNVISEALGTTDSTRRVITAGEFQTLLDLHDLPTFKSIGRTKVLKDDLDTGETVEKFLLPQDSLILAPSSGNPGDPESSVFGRTYWGQTLSGDTEDFNLSGAGMDLPGVVAAVIEKGWPSSMEVIADSIAMPVVHNANYTLKAKVV